MTKTISPLVKEFIKFFKTQGVTFVDTETGQEIDGGEEE